MEIQDIVLGVIPINTSEAANAIRSTQTMSGQYVLNAMPDKQVVMLWQFGLAEAHALSTLNQSRGKPPINYPHLWVRSNLFRLILPRWLEQEQEAQKVLKKIQAGTTQEEVLPPVPAEYYEHLRNKTLPTPNKMPPLPRLMKG